MKYLLFTDTHFNCRGGSMTWWNAQQQFIYKQLMPELDKHDELVIVHLGDVFDSRSTVNTYIASRVRKMFEELAAHPSVKEVNVICGNHDMYSPISDEVISTELILNHIDKVNLITRDVVEDGNIVYIPWVVQGREGIEELSRKYKGKTIFTHADIIMGSPKMHTPVFSGHVHIPYINGNVRNLGSCFPMTFADHNSARYFYIWDSKTDDLTRITNKYSIRFWRLNESELGDWDWSKVGQNDYIELYISFSLATQEEFQSLYKELGQQFRNLRLFVNPDVQAEDQEFVNCDIESIIEQSIPDHLREKYELVKSLLKTDEHTE